MDKAEIKTDKLLNLIHSRASTRAFAAKPVETEKLEMIFEAMRWAPSSMNEQPWHILYAHKGSEAHEKIAKTLFDGNKIWASEAPVLMATFARTGFSQREQENFHALYDLGQSMGYFTLEATQLGLKMRQMGGFDHEKMIEYFNIPETHKPVSCLALGYEGDINNLPEKLRQLELNPRTRRTTSDFAYANNWPGRNN